MQSLTLYEIPSNHPIKGSEELKFCIFCSYYVQGFSVSKFLLITVYFTFGSKNKNILFIFKIFYFSKYIIFIF